eukprot:CAMPEP_0172598504 /NCGR_PEP_ID=MMETSP1068-20121228/18534_1 /TAXON_ID=35684 /ORGANISM="Pseudopedinella elastica, Strain CCMP716" /LENGTH=328 /DNA_ID=CAMNT_0013398391 /DNA_START=250 /DNA_END=1236 /DNA_ORIENTATION=-
MTPGLMRCARMLCSVLLAAITLSSCPTDAFSTKPRALASGRFAARMSVAEVPNQDLVAAEALKEDPDLGITLLEAHDSSANQPFRVNSLVLAILAASAALALVHNDVSTISALYSYDLPGDHESRLAIVAQLLSHLPEDWLAWYDSEALTFPLITKASTSGVCYFLGDLAAQAISGKTDVEELDLSRSARSAAAGFLGHGPIAHYWLGFLDTLSFDGAWWAFFVKIFLDQGPMSIVYNTIYSLLLGAFTFRPPVQVLNDVKDALVPGFIASVKFWPFVHIITFSTLIPPELELLWVDLMEIIWVCILSRVNNEELSRTHKQKRAEDSQ